MIGIGTQVNFNASAVQQFFAPLQGLIAELPRSANLADKIAELLPLEQLSGVDIGCGLLDNRVNIVRPAIKLIGVDVEKRENTSFPVMTYDGLSIPFPDKSVDVAFLVNVLHSSENPAELLCEAARVARRYIIVKDYFCETSVDEVVMDVVDCVRNREAAPARTRREWLELFSELRFDVHAFETRLRLSSNPFGVMFDRQMHLLTKLAV